MKSQNDILEKLELLKKKAPPIFQSDIENTLEEASEIIKNLRSALRSIGYDYVELSHDKIQWLYNEHMKTARQAYQNSFPQVEAQEPKSLNDNF